MHLGDGSSGRGGTLHGSQEVLDLVGGEVLTVRGVCQGKVREDSLELEAGLSVDEVCQTQQFLGWQSDASHARVHADVDLDGASQTACGSTGGRNVRVVGDGEPHSRCGGGIEVVWQGGGELEDWSGDAGGDEFLALGDVGDGEPVGGVGALGLQGTLAGSVTVAVTLDGEHHLSPPGLLTNLPQIVDDGCKVDDGLGGRGAVRHGCHCPTGCPHDGNLHGGPRRWEACGVMLVAQPIRRDGNCSLA